MQLLPLLLFFLASYLGVKTFALRAYKRGLLDRPDDVRKEQKTPVPVGGGVVVVFLFLVAAIYYAFNSYVDIGSIRAAYYGVILAAFLAWLGLRDDRLGLSAKTKLFSQLLPILGTAVLWFHPFARNVELLFAHQNQPFALVPLAGIVGLVFLIFWLFACVNSFNLLDGADGFATTYAISVVATLLGVMTMWTERSPYMETLCWTTLAILAGFLVVNAPPAKVYLGDAGSLSIGAILGVLTLYCFSFERYVRPLPVLCILTIPAIDSTFAVVRRLLLGRSIFSADLEHLHHKLQRRFGRGFPTLFALVCLQLPICLATLAGYFYGYDLVPLGTAIAYWILLPLSGLFGRNEARLALARLDSLRARYFDRPSYDAQGLFVDPSFSNARAETWRSLLTFAREKNAVSFKANANYPSAQIDWFGEWRARPSERIDEIAFEETLAIDENVVGTLRVSFAPTQTNPEEAFEAVDALRNRVCEELRRELGTKEPVSISDADGASEDVESPISEEEERA